MVEMKWKEEEKRGESGKANGGEEGERRDGGRGSVRLSGCLGVLVWGVTLTSPQEQQVKTADDGEGN